MTFIPDKASAATYPAQSAPDSVDFDILLAAVQRIGVVSGGTVTAQGTPDMTLAVAAGVTEGQGIRFTVTAGNVTITTADVINPRFDLVVADSTGAKQVRAGTPGTNPVFPSLTAGDVALCAVYVPAGVTAITSGMLVDKRITLFTAAMMAVYGDGSDGVINFDGTTTRLGLAPSSGVYTLTRDIYLDDGSQLSGTAVIAAASYKIYCRGTFTVGSGRTIRNNGANATGNVAGATPTAQSLGTGASGGNGGSGTTGSGGAAATSAPLGAVGGAGGLSSGGGTGGGPAGGAATAVAIVGLPHSLDRALNMIALTTASAFAKWQGGAGGGGGTAATSSTGGGGGGGGGIVWLACRDLVNNGTIAANGGTGAAATGSGTGAGGGGGGGGGAVVTITGTYSGTGSITMTGGSGGAPQGAGATGASGSNGSSFQLQN